MQLVSIILTRIVLGTTKLAQQDQERIQFMNSSVYRRNLAGYCTVTTVLSDYSAPLAEGWWHADARHVTRANTSSMSRSGHEGGPARCGGRGRVRGRGPPSWPEFEALRDPYVLSIAFKACNFTSTSQLDHQWHLCYHERPCDHTAQS